MVKQTLIHTYIKLWTPKLIILVKSKYSFVATKNAGMSWGFTPSISQLTVHPGEPGTLNFTAKNPTDKRMIGPSYTECYPF